ncbi:hypothetical protein [Pontibacter sp. G13]|uniref:hypothetical protein n=1 Tax=Pontibacter sp. G13 TaxID=3074898 RepID=UPI002889A463|nr:hypothetical protein [Pontibacter sp. G13]WNJ18396.1 hypothetical protein RJD25_26375 [Pontibacter sp. G13]
MWYTWGLLTFWAIVLEITYTAVSFLTSEPHDPFEMVLIIGAQFAGVGLGGFACKKLLDYLSQQAKQPS